MKYFETKFEDYIIENNRQNLHPRLHEIYKFFPDNIENLKNLIFYGTGGIGKYTQVLSSIKKYSPTNLKYERKINITYGKKHPYEFKTSDIHFEIDMELLGCNAKILWNEIYNHIRDVLVTKPKPYGIIICKNFHKIHNELLDVFYSYIQPNLFCNEKLIFILITENIGFIPYNIIQCSKIISVPRPTKKNYNICIQKKLKKKIKLKNIKNIKDIKTTEYQKQYSHKIICRNITEQLENYKELNFMNLREELYNIFIYHFDINDCIWEIICNFIYLKKINSDNMCNILIKLYFFLRYYNNNYRPIFHLENFFLYLCKTIHEL